MRPSTALQANRETLRRMADHWGFPEVRVFGSTARGEDRDGSDLDLLIYLRDDSKFFDAFGLIADLEKLNLSVKVDAIIDMVARPSVLAAATTEGFLL